MAQFMFPLSFDMPADIDPCGENGEFHTFAFDGPMFRQPVPVKLESRREDQSYAYADLCPASFL